MFFYICKYDEWFMSMGRSNAQDCVLFEKREISKRERWERTHLRGGGGWAVT